MADIDSAEKFGFVLIGKKIKRFGDIAFWDTHTPFYAFRTPILKRKPFRVRGRNGHDALCTPIRKIRFILRFRDLLG